MKRWELLLVLASLGGASCGGKAGSEDGAPRPPDEASEDEPVLAPVDPIPPVDPLPEPTSPPDPTPPDDPPPEPTSVPDERQPNPSASPYRLATDAVLAVLERNCGACHGRVDPDAPRGELEFSDDIDQMVEIGLVVPLRSDESLAYQMMRDGRMPPPGVEPRPSAVEMDIVRAYIDNPRFWPVSQPARHDAGNHAPSLDIDAGAGAG